MPMKYYKLFLDFSLEADPKNIPRIAALTQISGLTTFACGMLLHKLEPNLMNLIYIFMVYTGTLLLYLEGQNKSWSLRWVEANCNDASLRIVFLGSILIHIYVVFQFLINVFIWVFGA